MPIKLIAIDLDGTLLNDQKLVSDENRDALSAAEDMGVLVTISSGRSSPNAWLYSRMAGIRHSPVISNNGPRVQGPGGALIAEKCLPPEIAREIARRWQELGLFYIIHNDDIEYYSSRPDNYRQLDERDIQMGIAPHRIYGYEPLYERGALHAHKVVMFDEDRARVAQARAALEDMADVLEFNSSWWNNVEAMTRGVDKGWAIDQLCAHYGIKKDEVMAFGDNDNDRAMLMHAGWPVVMENGTPAMKRIARLIAPDCNESGVGRIVREYVLSGRIV